MASFPDWIVILFEIDISSINRATLSLYLGRISPAELLYTPTGPAIRRILRRKKNSCGLPRYCRYQIIRTPVLVAGEFFWQRSEDRRAKFTGGGSAREFGDRWPRARRISISQLTFEFNGVWRGPQTRETVPRTDKGRKKHLEEGMRRGRSE